MKMTIAQYCYSYDLAQGAARDPKKLEKQQSYLDIMHDMKKVILKMCRELMGKLSDPLPAGDQVGDPLVASELGYFNTWFNLRGGWMGGDFTVRKPIMGDPVVTLGVFSLELSKEAP